MVEKIIVLVLLVLGLLLIHWYFRSRFIQYFNVLKEINNGEIGVYTLRYLKKTIVNAEYKLEKYKSKFEAIPNLKEYFQEEIDFYKEISSREDKKLSVDEKLKFQTILKTKLIHTSILSL